MGKTFDMTPMVAALQENGGVSNWPKLAWDAGRAIHDRMQQQAEREALDWDKDMSMITPFALRAPVMTVFGVKFYVNDALPPNVIELRSADGQTVLKRVTFVEEAST